jgi:hypothetical protein
MQSDDLGLVERLRRGPVAYTSAGGPIYDGPDPLMDEAAAAIERLVAEMDEAFEISAKIADACRADIERNPHDFGPLDQGGIRASEKIAAAIRARQALGDT